MIFTNLHGRLPAAVGSFPVADAAFSYLPAAFCHRPGPAGSFWGAPKRSLGTMLNKVVPDPPRYFRYLVYLIPHKSVQNTSYLPLVVTVERLW